MITSEQIMNMTELLQDNCHKTVKAMKEQKPDLSVQDATNVWIFNRLAILTLMIEDLAKMTVKK